MSEHVRSLDTNADDASEQTHHSVRSLFTRLRLVEASHPLLFDLLDLFLDESQPGYVAPQLGHGQRWNGAAFRCA